MFDHISTYAIAYEATKAFYDAALGTLGYSRQAEFVADWDCEFPTRRACAYGRDGHTAFWVIETKQSYTPRHVAFTAKDRAAVQAFYDASVEAGGRDNGAPGPRPIYGEHYYGGFVFDPDGNNVEAVCRAPAADD